ncbi:fused response regulator/phosphatase [Clostridium sp. D2Q-14]|uniref:fused response regulator/phosphatase n=1 Tax=Anaeromonas gelatinilytica TaxID=2683194 RepID=UPI00193C3DD4|nr:fused response regulator/phosphatase [Anaeromonas gelatinilytica]MBS4534134.1 fused response regulator/phosphatase [Anaeromonas gelatinilytica]
MKNNILIASKFAKDLTQISSIINSTMEDIFIFKACDGIETLETIYSNNIDLIIVDLNLPKKDGLKVIETIKYSSIYKDIPVIIYTSNTNKEIINKTLDLDVMGCYFKPLSSEDINYFLPIKIKTALKFYSHRKYLLKVIESNKEDLKLAKILQNSLMFNYKNDINVEMIGKYLPSDGLGGDCYDSIIINDKTWFMIADVMGHGVTSAMVSFMVKALFNQLVTYDLSPKELLKAMNTTYCNMIGVDHNIIFSIFIGTISNNEFTFSSAGHPYPIVYNNEKSKISFLENTNMLMGITPETTFDECKQNINSKDLVFLYTDGLYERNNSTQGLDTLINYAKVHQNLLSENPELFLNDILNEFTINNSIDDDIALLMIKKK